MYEILENSPIHHEPVYIGGDDVMLAFNIINVFDVIHKIRNAYPSSLGNCENTTASAGIIITHYKYPLREALIQLRKTEKKAKNMEGKDSVAITVLAKSGNRLDTVQKWEYEINCNDTQTFFEIISLLVPKKHQSIELLEYIKSGVHVNTMELLQTLILLFDRDIISQNFIQTLKEEFKFELSSTKNVSNASEMGKEIIQVITIELYRQLIRSIKKKNFDPQILPSLYQPNKMNKENNHAINDERENREEQEETITKDLLLKIAYHSSIILEHTRDFQNLLELFEIARFVATKKGKELSPIVPAETEN